VVKVKDSKFLPGRPNLVLSFYQLLLPYLTNTLETVIFPFGQENLSFIETKDLFAVFTRAATGPCLKPDESGLSLFTFL